MQQLYSPHLLALFFWITVYGWLAIESVMNLRHKPSHRTKAGMRSDALLTLSVGTGMLVAIALKGALPAANIYSNSVFFWAGLLLAWGGIALRLAAIKALGEFFVYTITTKDNQPVITTGPYRYIRHPSYLGSLMTIIGVAIALNSLPGAVFFIILASLAVIHRIGVEEDYLAKALGKTYQDYIEHTNKLIPLVW